MAQFEKYVRVFDKKKVILEKELGSGSFGRVCRATILDSKLPSVAIKIFWPQLQTTHTVQKAYEELNKVGSLEHENVVKLIGMVEDDIPWLVFEYLKGGNLLEYVIEKKNIKEKDLIKYCRDITRGMAYLHRNYILHKDLAARNILLDNKIAKIADLGMSSILSQQDEAGVNYSVVGKMLAFRHAASECIVEGIYTYESDIWSMGILMWEIWSGGDVPYGEKSKEADVRRTIAEGGNPMLVKLPQCSTNIHLLMEYILQVDKNERPTFHELRMIFEHILEGGKFRRIHNSQQPNPTFHEMNHSHINTDNFNNTLRPKQSLQINQINKNSSSSTPNLDILNKSNLNIPKIIKTSLNNDFLEIPKDYNMSRSLSDYDGIDISKNLISSTQKKMFSSANNLNQQNGKNQYDLQDEFLKDLIQNRFQRKK